jgi:hypothetical protein
MFKRWMVFIVVHSYTYYYVLLQNSISTVLLPEKTIPMSTKLLYFLSLSVRATALLTSQYGPSTLDLDLIRSLLPHASNCATEC